MTTMVTEMYDALLSAGASEEKARAAASVVAAANQGASKSDVVELRSELKADTAEFRADMKSEFASFRLELATKADRTDLAVVKTDAAVLKWGAGLGLAMLASLVAKAFF